MDTVEALKREAMECQSPTKASWRENGERLIWCGIDAHGTVIFRNTTEALRSGPKISEIEAAHILASEGPWLRPSR